MFDIAWWCRRNLHQTQVPGLRVNSLQRNWGCKWSRMNRFQDSQRWRFHDILLFFKWWLTISMVPRKNHPENTPSQKETIVFQPSIFRDELLVLGSVCYTKIYSNDKYLHGWYIHGNLFRDSRNGKDYVVPTGSNFALHESTTWSDDQNRWIGNFTNLPQNRLFTLDFLVGWIWSSIHPYQEVLLLATS